MTALVYRVSCASRGDLWFADVVEAEAAAQEILRGGEAVGLYPVPVPETAADFVAFATSHRPRRPYATGGIVAPGHYIVGEVPLPFVVPEGIALAETPSAADHVPEAPEADEPAATECGARMERALQWLLDDLHTAGETHGENGHIYDSVADAAAALVEAGGYLSWYSPADVAAYRVREGVSRNSAGKYNLPPDTVLLADDRQPVDSAPTLKDALNQIYGFIPGARL